MRIGVTYGMRGYFAVMYDHEGPYATGIGSYRTSEEARREALSWAIAEGLSVDWCMTPDEEDQRYEAIAAKHGL